MEDGRTVHVGSPDASAGGSAADNGSFFEPLRATESDINTAGMWMVVGSIVSMIGFIVAIAVNGGAAAVTHV